MLIIYCFSLCIHGLAYLPFFLWDGARLVQYIWSFYLYSNYHMRTEYTLLKKLVWIETIMFITQFVIHYVTIHNCVILLVAWHYKMKPQFRIRIRNPRSRARDLLLLSKSVMHLRRHVSLGHSISNYNTILGPLWLRNAFMRSLTEHISHCLP